jgi:hypothetical protein
MKGLHILILAFAALCCTLEKSSALSPTPSPSVSRVSAGSFGKASKSALSPTPSPSVEKSRELREQTRLQEDKDRKNAEEQGIRQKERK